MQDKIEYNWYEILGLEYYPNPVRDREVIKSRIEEKEKFWISNREDMNRGPEYSKYIGMKKRMTEELLGEGSEIDKFIKDAQRKLFEELDNYLESLKGKVITRKKIETLVSLIKVKNSKITEADVKARMKKFGIEFNILENAETYKSYRNTLRKKLVFGFENELKILGKEDLYEFLESEGFNLKIMTPWEILSEIEIRRESLKKPTSETTARKRLFGECEKLINDSLRKREYDKYLKCRKVEKELEEIKSYGFLQQPMPKQKAGDVIARIGTILGNETEGKDIFTGFCEENDIIYETLETGTVNSGNRQHKEKKPEQRKWEGGRAENTERREREKPEVQLDNRNKRPGLKKNTKIVVAVIIALSIIGVAYERISSSNIPSGKIQENNITQTEVDIVSDRQSAEKAENTTFQEKKRKENTTVSQAEDSKKQEVSENSNRYSSYSDYELRIARNTIFAKNGYCFSKSGEMYRYFKNTPWYNESECDTKDSDFIINNRMNSADYQIFQEIIKEECSRKPSQVFCKYLK